MVCSIIFYSTILTFLTATLKKTTKTQSLESPLTLCWTRLYLSTSQLNQMNELLLLKKRSRVRVNCYLENFTSVQT